MEVAAARAAAAAAAAPKYACAPVSQPNASQEYAADATSHVIATQYNCGQEGHISAECPNPKVEGGVKKCYNCGELGHISADCPQPRKEREPRAPRNGDRKGYSEHDDRGGMAKPNRKEERACRICGKIGHLARDCRSAGAKTDKTCRICGKVGHLARDCRSKGAQKGGKGQKRGRGGPRSASDLDKEMDLYHGKPAKKGKPTAEDLDAEMDAYNKAAATGAVAAEA